MQCVSGEWREWLVLWVKERTPPPHTHLPLILPALSSSCTSLTAAACCWIDWCLLWSSRPFYLHCRHFRDSRGNFIVNNLKETPRVYPQFHSWSFEHKWCTIRRLKVPVCTLYGCTLRYADDKSHIEKTGAATASVTCWLPFFLYCSLYLCLKACACVFCYTRWFPRRHWGWR